GNTSISNNSDQLAAVTLGLDWRGTDTRIDADFGYMNRLIIGAQGGTGVAAGLLVPSAPSAATNFYQPWTFYQAQGFYGDVRLEHDFYPGLTGFMKIGARNTNANYLLAFPTITSALGNYTATPSKTIQFNQALSIEAGMRGRFETGPISHEAVFSGGF